MKFSNDYNLPQALADALTLDTYDHQTDNIYSVSTLIAPPKMTILRKRHFDLIQEDVSEGCWRLFGSAVHEVLARAVSKDRLTEERIYIDLADMENATTLSPDNIYISGKPDLYDGTIDDYKVTSVWSVIFDPQGKREWHEQLNAYAYLYRKAGFTVKGLRIVAILRDWSASKALQDPSYPRIPFAVIDIPMWTEEAQKEFLIKRVKLHREGEELKDDDIPECTPEERWEKPTTYALCKDGRKTAVKIYDNKAEATQRVTELGKSHYIQTRPGRCTRCFDYCPANKFCNFFKELTK